MIWDFRVCILVFLLLRPHSIYLGKNHFISVIGFLRSDDDADDLNKFMISQFVYCGGKVVCFVVASCWVLGFSELRPSSSSVPPPPR